MLHSLPGFAAFATRDRYRGIKRKTSRDFRKPIVAACCAGDDVAVARKWRHSGRPSRISILDISSSRPNFRVSNVTSERSGNGLSIATKKRLVLVALYGLKTSISRVLDQISEFRLRRLLADVESSLTSGRDVPITSSAVSIRTVLCFFSTSKSICDVVSGAIAPILVSKTVVGRRDSETVEISRKSRSAEELFAFWRKAFFRFSRTFCLGTLFLKVAPLRPRFRSIASVRS